MPDVGDFGERAATSAEVAQWVSLVRAGQTASKGMRVKADEERRRDQNRPSSGRSADAE